MNLEELNRLYLQRVNAYMAYCQVQSPDLWRAYQRALQAEGELQKTLERETGRKLRISQRLDGFRFEEEPARLAKRSRVGSERG